MRILLLCLLAASLAGCGGSQLYEQDITLARQVWGRDTSLVYKIQVDDVSKPLQLRYSLRYDLTYPYYNLYIRYRIEDTARNVLAQDRQELLLMDAETGKPLGSGLGGVFNRDFTALEGIRFTRPGPYRVVISQYMQMQRLPGIHSFGIGLYEQDKD